MDFVTEAMLCKVFRPGPLIVTVFMTIDARFVILWDFEYLKKNVVALTFVKLELLS